MQILLNDLANVSDETFKKYCQSNFYKFKISEEKMKSNCNLENFDVAANQWNQALNNNRKRHEMIDKQAHCGSFKHFGQWTTEETEFFIQVLTKGTESGSILNKINWLKVSQLMPYRCPKACRDIFNSLPKNTKESIKIIPNKHRCELVPQQTFPKKKRRTLIRNDIGTFRSK